MIKLVALQAVAHWPALLILAVALGLDRPGVSAAWEERALKEGARMPEELTIGEVADHFRVTKRTVQRWLMEDELPGAYQLPGGAWRIPREALEYIKRMRGRKALTPEAARP